MQDPANIPVDVMCQVDERKQESIVFQFQSILGRQVSKVSFDDKTAVECAYRNFAAVAATHSSHGHRSRGSCRGSSCCRPSGRHVHRHRHAAMVHGEMI